MATTTGSANESLCGYTLPDVRRSLRDAIDRGDRRAAARWTAELVATPAAIGSLWASYWVAWATAAGGPSPTTPILLRQTWETITEGAHHHLTAQAVTGVPGWSAFRNDPEVRAIAAETTTRLLGLPRQTPVVWPNKEIILYDVDGLRAAPVPAAADSPHVLSVWNREEDGLELRLMAGRFLAALERGELRSALSAVAWTLLPATVAELKIGERGPTTLTPKQRASPIWYWLEIGRAYLNSRTGLHRGWPTAHRAIADAFRLHWRRWSATERMRVLLAWILQIRATMTPQPETLWVAPPLQLLTTEIDIPYREIAAELADPEAPIRPATEAPAVPLTEKELKRQAAAAMEEKMAAADAKIMAMMGMAGDN
jgi:hypothetical protein